MNTALLGKRLWCFTTQEDHLWRIVIQCKYISKTQGVFLPKGVIQLASVTIWKGSFQPSFLSQKEFDCCSKQDNVCFWKDLWLDDASLEAQIPNPNLFLLTTEQNSVSYNLDPLFGHQLKKRHHRQWTTAS
ncbi:hypothetical protein AMTRI_Chr10g200 [Amborella trichopoda]